MIFVITIQKNKKFKTLCSLTARNVARYIPNISERNIILRGEQEDLFNDTRDSLNQSNIDKSINMYLQWNITYYLMITDPCYSSITDYTYQHSVKGQNWKQNVFSETAVTITILEFQELRLQSHAVISVNKFVMVTLRFIKCCLEQFSLILLFGISLFCMCKRHTF